MPAMPLAVEQLRLVISRVSHFGSSPNKSFPQQPKESTTPTPDMVTLGGERHEDRASSFWERDFPFSDYLNPTNLVLCRKTASPLWTAPATNRPLPTTILLSHTRT